MLFFIPFPLVFFFFTFTTPFFLFSLSWNKDVHALSLNTNKIFFVFLLTLLFGVFGHYKTSCREEMFLLFSLFSDPASVAVFIQQYSSTRLGVISTMLTSNAWLFVALCSWSAFVHPTLLYRKFYLFRWCFFPCTNQPPERWLWVTVYFSQLELCCKLTSHSIFKHFVCYDLARVFAWCIPDLFIPHPPQDIFEVVFWIPHVQYKL